MEIAKTIIQSIDNTKKECKSDNEINVINRLKQMSIATSSIPYFIEIMCSHSYIMRNAFTTYTKHLLTTQEFNQLDKLEQIERIFEIENAMLDILVYKDAFEDLEIALTLISNNKI